PESYTIRYETPHKKEYEQFSGGVYVCGGSLKDNGQQFETAFRISTDGELSFREGRLEVRDASRLTIIHTAATDYLPRFPDYKGNNYREGNRRVLASAGKSTFEALLEEHLQDYKSLFGRVSLELAGERDKDLPTDQRQKAYYEGASDPGLEALYFQYARYLMIASSRPGTLPMHLQGKWNHSTNPPWACDYHMNINEQMLYWPAEVTGLPECHLPLFDYMQQLREPGRLAAREFFNAAAGSSIP
ncbi:MAG TPA: glycoside hydrolase N-terminal domain-containing protein, partial [Anseongella sp.]|nr:glycoside hydrolase N-terminal domain-containing protein [Anseongella sp.]